jgi:uncharacterized alkaline shock family protein YloU
MSSWPNGTSKRTFPTAAAATAARPDSDSASAPEEPQVQPGSVRIARRVLRTVVEQAALGVPGVARLATGRGGRRSLLVWGEAGNGVRLDVRGEVVGIDLYLIAAPGASMVDTGTAVQEAVGAAVEHILGMGVSAINVYIQDVA